MIVVSVQVGSRFPVDRKTIRSCIFRVLAERHVDDVEVSVSVVGARKMTALNETLMKHEGATDVLSFPQHDLEQRDKEFPHPIKNQIKNDTLSHLGDIVVCFPEAVKEARKLGRMVDQQICFLVEHGLLHLLGFHHD